MKGFVYRFRTLVCLAVIVVQQPAGVAAQEISRHHNPPQAYSPTISLEANGAGTIGWQEITRDAPLLADTGTPHERQLYKLFIANATGQPLQLPPLPWPLLQEESSLAQFNSSLIDYWQAQFRLQYSMAIDAARLNLAGTANNSALLFSPPPAKGQFTAVSPSTNPVRLAIPPLLREVTPTSLNDPLLFKAQLTDTSDPSASWLFGLLCIIVIGALAPNRHFYSSPGI